MLHRIWRFFSDTWYWIRTHTYNRYHIIDCRDSQNGYAWGWCDRDHLMLFACFKILTDFMEREYPYAYGMVDWDSEEVHLDTKKAHEEIKYLYDWWKK